jgi:hypothetical protein
MITKLTTSKYNKTFTHVYDNVLLKYLGNQQIQKFFQRTHLSALTCLIVELIFFLVLFIEPLK